jgi:hypothetical protein
MPYLGSVGDTPRAFELRCRSPASIQTPGSLMSSGAALSPRLATHLSFASPKESKPRKGDPTFCVPSLRYGQPAVLGPAGVPLALAALRQSRALIRLGLRSSAHTKGVGSGFGEHCARFVCSIMLRF